MNFEEEEKNYIFTLHIHILSSSSAATEIKTSK